jgi:head-tail adaptor
VAALFPARCTIQRPANTNTKGDVSKSPWTDVAGLTALPCRVSPIAGREVRGADMTYAVGTHYITLAGSYPSIAMHMRAVVAGVAYDIEAVATDGEGAMTRLTVRVLS